jgi:hypothetical protein
MIRCGKDLQGKIPYKLSVDFNNAGLVIIRRMAISNGGSL